MRLIDATLDLMKLLYLIKSLVEVTQELSNTYKDIESVVEGMKNLSR